MKILYAIQGTGNGHLARARHIIPFLKEKGEVDILLSGCHSEISLPWEIKYRLLGLGFVFGKKGGIDFLKTYQKNKVRKLISEIRNLPIHQYDLVISDFEPISSWACWLRNKVCVGLSNQAVALSPGVPICDSKDWMGKAVLSNYAPATVKFGFHFQKYNPGVFNPIVRQEVRNVEVTNEGHYLVYLPFYSDDRIINALVNIPQVEWQVFSKYSTTEYRQKNVWIRPITNDAFLQSMASSAGILSSAGFTLPSEAIYLGKKLLVMPQKNQFEQQCNAMALNEMGIQVVKTLKPERLPEILRWINLGKAIKVEWQDETQLMVHQIMDYYNQYVAVPANTISNTNISEASI